MKLPFTDINLRRLWRPLNLLLSIVAIFVIGACATIGRPEGGPRDVKPPVPTGFSPLPGSLNFTGNRLTVTFDENIQLDDAFSKVVVSPPMNQPPSVSANGRRLTVEFRDTLQANTTYTVDLADAIKDLNEGNVLDGFAIDFSTGDAIDTLRISGMVLDAATLEPAQGLLVGVHSNTADSAITTLPFDRIARTNQYGQFTVRNLAPGQYRVFALDDVNRDYKWDPSEAVAFFDEIVSPTVQNFAVTDTLRSAAGSDSTAIRTGIRYLPNDVLLTTFLEAPRNQYLKNYERTDRRRITINMGIPADSLPQMTVAYGPLAGTDFSTLSVAVANPGRDSLTYWLADPRVLDNDTLRLAVRYLKTDSAGLLAPTIDTLRFDYRAPRSKKSDKQQVAVDSLGNPVRTEWLGIRAVSGTNQELNRQLLLEFTEPLASLDSLGVHLDMKVDTLWQPVDDFRLMPDSIAPVMRRTSAMTWRPGAHYRLTIDSAAVYNIYGDPNKPYTHEFDIKGAEEYSSVTFRLTGIDPDTPVVMELLSSSDAPVYRVAGEAGALKMPLLAPNTYYARVIIDSDRNGVWTSGDMASHRQPEEVYYFNKKLTLKKNWDITQQWDIFELPLDTQKPLAIKKNKPKTQPGQLPLTDDEDDDEDEMPYDPHNPFGMGVNNNRR